MTKMGQKLTNRQRFLKKVRLLVKSRKTPRKPIKRSNLRRTKKVAVRLPRSKKYSELVSELDTLVSRRVLREAGYRCVRCGKQYVAGQKELTCSHYWSRVHRGARWDPDNLDALCWMPCHVKWEKEKQGEYMDFMLRKLGQAGYDLLKIKAHSDAHFTRGDLEILIYDYQRAEQDKGEGVPPSV